MPFFFIKSVCAPSHWLYTNSWIRPCNTLQHLLLGSFPIGDVANWKCHQWLDEILTFFYPHNIREISKVVFKKTLLCNTPAKLYAIPFAQHTLAVMRAFHTAQACYKCVHFWHSFLTTLLVSCIVRVKTIKISSSRWWRFELATSAIAVKMSL